MIHALRLFCCVCVCVSLCSTIVAQDDIPDLENYYSFDDPEDFTSDESGNGRDAELDDTGGVEWVDDPIRGGVMEFPGSTNGFLAAELPEDGLPGDNFTIAFWAYRDPELCCGAGGANDGMFQVQFDPVFPSTSTKVIGGWVQKSDGEIWGRVIQEDGSTINQERGIAYMDDEEWTHFAYRGNGDDFEVVINGEAGDGPSSVTMARWISTMRFSLVAKVQKPGAVVSMIFAFTVVR